MLLNVNEVIFKFNSQLWFMAANSVGTDLGLLEKSGPPHYRHVLILGSM